MYLKKSNPKFNHGDKNNKQVPSFGGCIGFSLDLLKKEKIMNLNDSFEKFLHILIFILF